MFSGEKFPSLKQDPRSRLTQFGQTTTVSVGLYGFIEETKTMSVRAISLKQKHNIIQN